MRFAAAQRAALTRRLGAQSGEWGPGPTCKETGRELGFSFGLDNFLYCGIEVRRDSARVTPSLPTD